MTPAELRSLILALAADHPARVAYTAGEDVLCSQLLSAPTLPGRVPIVELTRYLYDTGVYAKASVVVGMPVPDTNEGKALYGLCCSILGVVRDLPDVNVQSTVFAAGLTAFTGLGWLTSGLAAEIAALGNNRTPIASVTPAEVEAARKI